MRRLALAIAAFAALTGAASAATAYVELSLNVRAGPGTNNAIVDTLRPGEKLTVTECEGNWCYIRHTGPDGWVSARHLTFVTSGRRIRFRDPCDFDSETDFHLRFGLYHTPLARYCREREE